MSSCPLPRSELGGRGQIACPIQTERSGVHEGQERDHHCAEGYCQLSKKSSILLPTDVGILERSVGRQGEFALPRIILETNGLTYKAGHRQAFLV